MNALHVKVLDSRIILFSIHGSDKAEGMANQQTITIHICELSMQIELSFLLKIQL